MLFAVIETGGKQYKVAEGDTITVEKLPGDHKPGDTITFDKVLLSEAGTSVKIGAPYLLGVEVAGTLELISRKPKVTVIKYKAKSRYFKKRGHRQPYMKVKITKLV